MDHEIVESLELMIRKLNDEYNNGALLVVEGKRDTAALKRVGYIGKPFTLCHNESLSSLVTTAEKYRKVILFLDLDQKGRVLTKKAASILQGRKIPIDLFFRRRLRATTKGRVAHVEELDRYAEFLDGLGVLKEAPTT